MDISTLKINQLFKIVGDEAVYKYHGSWLEDGMPWQSQYQNVETKKIFITSKYVEVVPIAEPFRIFVEFSDGSHINTMMNNFNSELTKLVKQCGKPIKIELRSDDQWIKGGNFIEKP